MRQIYDLRRVSAKKPDFENMEEYTMLTDRIDKVVYTKNADGTAEKWYLEQILETGDCYLRKSPHPKWIDTKRIFKSDGVYESKKAALYGCVSQKA